MSDAERVPVVIVGAGPVGVTAALLLARRKVRTVVLERHAGVYPLPRAVAADDEIRRILQAAGVHEEFDAIARPARGLRLVDARHRVLAEFPRTARGHHGFPQTSMFDQPALEGVLRDALGRRPECELRGGSEVTAVREPAGGGPVEVIYRDLGADGAERRLLADAVLGCDGANSLVREAVGAAWEDLRFEETWTVVDVRTRGPVRTGEGVDQVCDPRRPATFMRVGEDRYRWEFRLPEGESLEGPGGREKLRELVAPWVDLAGPRDAEFEVVRQARYTFRARIADRWSRGRVFLLGDAAHTMPPFIGQGLCAGLRDAHNLAWKLARVLSGGAPARLLDTYQSERRPHARHVIRLAVVTGHAMTGGHDRAAALRRAALGAALRIPALTAAAGRDLSPALRAGPLVRRRARPGRRGLAGTFCPQPWVTSDAGDSRKRLDDVLAGGFAVLAAVPLPPALQAVADALGATTVDVDGIDGGTLAAWLREGGADAVLLRPDRVVLDTVPRGGRDFTGAAAWAPLLCTNRRAAPVAAALSSRSTTP